MPSRRRRTGGLRALRRGWARLGIPAAVAARAAGRLQREPARLVSIGRAPDDGRRLLLTPRAARAWRRMQSAAAGAGVVLLPLSAFRSVARQTRVVRGKLARGLTLAAILRVNAVPGCSEHHTGRALDLGTPGHLELEPAFARTAAYRWLRHHAGGFGFRLSYPRGNRRGVVYEPWHWCWHAPRRSPSGR